MCLDAARCHLRRRRHRRRVRADQGAEPRESAASHTAETPASSRGFGTFSPVEGISVVLETVNVEMIHRCLRRKLDISRGGEKKAAAKETKYINF